MKTDYKRILLKLSGESLMGELTSGIDPHLLRIYTQQIAEILQSGIQVGLVIGGGNIFRGVSGTEKGFDRVNGDYMGMLATVINGLALQSDLRQIDQPCELYTSIRMEPVGQLWSRNRVLEDLEMGKVCIFSAGTGNPFFTTDTTAALRAVEINADVLLKGTRVDGVYSADPEKDPGARRFDQISFDEVIEQNLRVMDQTAFTLCRENQLPILVFDMNTPGNLKRLISGENIGTIIRN